MNDLTIRTAPILDLPDSLEILLEGSITPATAPRLKERLDQALGKKAAYVCLLLRGVNYVSSAGLGYLMDLATRAERRGGSVVLVEAQPKVKVVLNNLGMNGFFRFEESAEAARAFLRAQAEKVLRSPRVVALDGDELGVVFPVVSAAIKIGSDVKSTILVRHPQAEPRHCEIYRTGEQCFVRDLGSRFGTYVGVRKVNDEPLHAGDVIKVGGTRLAFYPPGAKIS